MTGWPRQFDRSCGRLITLGNRISWHYLRKEFVVKTALMFIALLPGLHSTEIVSGREHVVSGKVGESVVLPCEVDTHGCGKIYVITWTKHIGDEWRRVYLYSDTHSKPMNSFAGRAHFILHNNSNAELHLRSLNVSDEGTYKCDVTYVHGKCPSLTFTKLYTLMKPKPPELYVDGSPIQNASTLGPYTEGSTFILDCRSSGGRPPPLVTLWNATKSLSAKSHVQTGEDGASDVIVTARFVLSRWDLESKLECRVQSNATLAPMVKWIKLDIHVKPVSLRVRGPTTPVVAGEMVSLTCTVEGSRPAASITWFNRSREVEPQPPASQDLMSDATYRTSSTLVFIASRHDHLGDFCCQGLNEVQKLQHQPPLLHAVTLDVLYPPSVSVQPVGGLIVNESGEAVLTCNFSANPPNVTEVIWYKDGLPLRQYIPLPVITPKLTKSPSASSSGSPSFVPSPQLILRRVSRKDAGSYGCHVRNAFGRGNSSNTLGLDVLYPPSVSVSVVPEVAAEMTEAVLSCNPIDGNPAMLMAVRWYHNDLPIFGDHAETERNELTLKNLTRDESGNYTCRGLNTAGWSSDSEAKYLDIHYPPGSATIAQLETVAVKSHTVTLSCQLDDLGHPEASKYLWESPTRVMSNNGSSNQVTTSASVLTMEKVNAASEGVYFCAGRNEVGTGPLGHFKLKLSAPPAFVRPLPKESGAARNASSVRLMCHVECDPLCNVTWYRGTDSLLDSKFFLTETMVLDPDPKRNVLKSVVSTLSWSLSHLPATSFDFSTFTCVSSANDLGPSVNSSTLFRIEYPPENIQVSLNLIDIVEGETPEDVVCSASAFPPGHYLWTVGETVLSRSHVLSFNASVTRDMAGNYSCNVKNSHGHARADLVLMVNHRPECSIRKDYNDQRQIVLICHSVAYPAVTNFSWFKDNVSLNGMRDAMHRNGRHESTLVLSNEDHNENLARYSCVSTNSMGPSDPCKLQLTSLPAPSGWVLQEENLIIVAGVAGGLVILMVFLVITAAVVAVKRRISAIDKPDIDERQNFDVRGPSGESNLCSSITPILPTSPNPLDSMGGVMMPLLSDMKKMSPPPRPHIISPLLHHGGKNLHNRRFLPNNCPDMYRVRDICQVDHGNNAG
ncbi:B-cell receptor CD22-like [Parasteatoda tepidariorum]|uniref:B-cell receptor CD22-like n=1 Tax=Parasteatoda tepidariorum TaxID=114398 RepID=UPI0039BC92EB